MKLGKSKKKKIKFGKKNSENTKEGKTAAFS